MRSYRLSNALMIEDESLMRIFVMTLILDTSLLAPGYTSNFRSIVPSLNEAIIESVIKQFDFS